MAVGAGILPPRYRSPALAGRGAMGDIFVATDETLGRRVAVKILAERYSRDEAIRRRFKREALAAARLSGEPGPVTIFDVGEWQGRPFIVMEFLAGGSLEDLLRRRGAQSPAQSLAWLEQAAAALDAAHRHGVVHRDVKPANLLLDGRGDVRVADFGIASAAGLDSMTLTGTVLGTAGYLSPEQALGERVGPASDLYALAIVAYELLSGHRPFESDSPTVEAAAHVNSPVPSIAERRRSLPAELDWVFERALAKDPRARFDSATEFVAALRDRLTPFAAPTARIAARPLSAVAPARRWRGGGRFLLAGSLLVAAAVGGVLGALLTGGGQDSRVATRRVVAPNGQTTTVHDTVTVQQTSAAPVVPQRPAAGADGHTLNDRGFRQIQQGAYAGALPLLRQATQKLRGTGPSDPYEGYANYNLGLALYGLGRCSEAVGYLLRAEQLEPDRHEPRQLLKKAERC
jgi:tRNA A-37 threonylcarbamoyl transferase component Bud32/GNAT superfamily N-acetyltransferase